MQSKPFRIGFLVGLLIFVAVNFFGYYRMRGQPVLTDASVGFGFPVQLYASSGFGGDNILWLGLIADVLIAACASILLGWAFDKVFAAKSNA